MGKMHNRRHYHLASTHAHMYASGLTILPFARCMQETQLGAFDNHNGPFGHGDSSCCILQPRLIQSSISVDPPNHHYMPHPRGALENLTLILMKTSVPGLGEVKVCIEPL